MGAVANTLGQGSEITYLDKTYRVAPWKYSLQGEFERYLERCAKQEAADWPGLPLDQKEQLCKAVHAEVLLGEYTFGKDKALQALDSPRHLIYLLWILIKHNHPEVTLSLVEDMYEAKGRELMQAMNEANADPTKLSNENAPRPV